MNVQGRLLGLSGELLREYLDDCTRMTKDNLLDIATTYIKVDDYPDFKNANLPILLVFGDDEPESTSHSAYVLQKLNKNCSVMKIKGCGHNIPYKKKSDFNIIVEAFLKM